MSRLDRPLSLAEFFYRIFAAKNVRTKKCRALSITHFFDVIGTAVALHVIHA